MGTAACGTHARKMRSDEYFWLAFAPCLGSVPMYPASQSGFLRFSDQDF